MTVLLYIVGYIVFSIAFAFFLKTIKIKAKEKKEKINSFSKAKQVANNIYDRKKHNDYMNNPKFSYMSCNKYNPESSFYIGKKVIKEKREKRYILLEESKYNKLFVGSYKHEDYILSQNDDLVNAMNGQLNGFTAAIHPTEPFKIGI